MAVSKEKEAPKPKKTEVGGNFSYTNTPGKFKEVLDGLIKADRPPKFNRDFIETVLGVKGGTVSGYPPILKRIGFLTSDNSPTELYGKFQSDSERSAAALEGLQTGFAELFKRNIHIAKATDDKVKDYLVQITGRTKDDPAVKSILGTFNAIRSYINEDHPIALTNDDALSEPESGQSASKTASSSSLGLSYHINIVLPETNDVTVFNAIFKSLRENLMDD